MADKRIIKYGDKEMPIPESMTLEQAKEQMARFFPELADPKVETKKEKNQTVYTLSKKAGTKGGEDITFTIDPIEGDSGFAVCINGDEQRRVDVFPPSTDDDFPGAFIAITEPRLTAQQARDFAVLLFRAAAYADELTAKAEHAAN